MKAKPNLFKRWFIGLAGLHFLVSCFLMLFLMATAYPSAATGSGPGLIGCLLVALQTPVFLLTSKFGDALSFPGLFILMLLSSLIYSYVITHLILRFGKHPDRDL